MGTKRLCQACGAKFFDMNRDKIVCPKCGSPFQVTLARAPSRAAARVEEEEKDTDAGVETVSLEDAEAGEEALVAGSEVEVEDDATANTFLEEEEDAGDDVSGLIDGDIETDEEP